MKDAISHLIQNDPVLKSIIENHGHPVVQKRDEGFASMVHIILEQQVSIASAKAAFQKLETEFGEISPENMLAASDESFRGCGISRQKTLYIKDMAQRVVSGSLDFGSFAFKTEEEIRAELLKIKGVGNWSAEVYLMFCLQSPDIMPLGDIAIRNTLKELFPVVSDEEMKVLSETWKPYRTAASYVLWHHYLRKRGRI